MLDGAQMLSGRGRTIFQTGCFKNEVQFGDNITHFLYTTYLSLLYFSGGV